jgi:hypothetical protein
MNAGHKYAQGCQRSHRDDVDLLRGATHAVHQLLHGPCQGDGLWLHGQHRQTAVSSTVRIDDAAGTVGRNQNNEGVACVFARGLPTRNTRRSLAGQIDLVHCLYAGCAGELPPPRTSIRDGERIEGDGSGEEAGGGGGRAAGAVTENEKQITREHIDFIFSAWSRGPLRKF